MNQILKCWQNLHTHIIQTHVIDWNDSENLVSSKCFSVFEISSSTKAIQNKPIRFFFLICFGNIKFPSWRQTVKKPDKMNPLLLVLSFLTKYSSHYFKERTKTPCVSKWWKNCMQHILPIRIHVAFISICREKKVQEILMKLNR